ncbi:FadR/GntR family transcriptional regulator [Agrococcus jenensis]|uniref:GntR family transcriptional regulator n=1 Tax=Agrococcus jenensis TaxID=46353 RepID=A0A3N2ASP8_9MICO|nr:FadR/GntR family transcriptional regulator [Agrococcus jenensis]ROR65772.1 GntR family transcriptional regulator [Agrococcus jenensis]
MTQTEPQPPQATNGNVRAEIIHALSTRMFSGDDLTGSKLPSERQLAEELGVGRAQVREAIQSLGLLGVVDIRHGDGTYLRESGSDLLPRVIEWGLFLGEPRVLDLIEARQYIEVALAGLAARRATDDDIAQMRASLEAMDRVSGDEAAFVDLDVEFHRVIAAAARNTALADVLSNITSLLRVWMARSLRAAGETTSSHGEHVAVVDAIASRDRRAAESAMRQHMRHAERRLKRTLGDAPSQIQVRHFPD